MQVLTPNPHVPLYSLEPDELTGNKHFRMYNFDGVLPDHADLLIPHRKDHYLIALIRHADSSQWVDMTRHVIKDNTVYFVGPNRVIVKEGHKKMWSTGIAFTKEFLSFQGNDSLSKLPLIENPQNGFELLLSAANLAFVEDMIAKLNAEYITPGEWQQRMLGAYFTLLVTYLSRLYMEQYRETTNSADKMLLRSFQAKINACFQELHEVGDYAALLNISAGHLSEVVKIQSGKPAIKHIHERLTLEAQRLLCHTNNALKEIAFDLGFTDASYFNRFFKRETGVTPAEYRANIREMYH